MNWKFVLVQRKPYYVCGQQFVHPNKKKESNLDTIDDSCNPNRSDKIIAYHSCRNKQPIYIS